MATTIKTDVIIVGAGPTGLSLACQLIRYGIDFIVVEKNEGVTPYSKALGVHARTLEIYEQLELATEAVKRGTIAVIWIMSPPCKIFEITAGPPEPAKSAAPDNMALKSADEAPIKTGSNSIAYLSKMRASLATNQGRQLRPMGENGKGTFLT